MIRASRNFARRRSRERPTFFTELKRLRNDHKLAVSFVPCGETSPLFEIARVPVRLDHVALTDLTHFRIFPRNLALHLTQYLNEHRQEGLKIMNDQDSGTIITTFLLLLPWLGRAAVATVALWRERIETQGRKAKLNF